MQGGFRFAPAREGAGGRSGIAVLYPRRLATCQGYCEIKATKIENNAPESSVWNPDGVYYSTSALINPFGSSKAQWRNHDPGWPDDEAPFRGSQWGSNDVLLTFTFEKPTPVNYLKWNQPANDRCRNKGKILHRPPCNNDRLKPTQFDVEYNSDNKGKWVKVQSFRNEMTEGIRKFDFSRTKCLVVQEMRIRLKGNSGGSGFMGGVYQMTFFHYEKGPFHFLAPCIVALPPAARGTPANEIISLTPRWSSLGAPSRGGTQWECCFSSGGGLKAKGTSLSKRHDEYYCTCALGDAQRSGTEKYNPNVIYDGPDRVTVDYTKATYTKYARSFNPLKFESDPIFWVYTSKQILVPPFAPLLCLDQYDN